MRTAPINFEKNYALNILVLFFTCAVSTGDWSNVCRLRTSTPLFQAYDHVYNLLEKIYCPLFYQSDMVSVLRKEINLSVTKSPFFKGISYLETNPTTHHLCLRNTYVGLAAQKNIAYFAFVFSVLQDGVWRSSS